MKYRQLIAFLFCVLLILSKPVSSQIKEFFITCEPDDFAHIYENYLEDIYIPISLSYNGIEWDDTFLRIRGDGSRQFPKKSLKLKFDGIPFVNGSSTLNFNAEYEDKSYLRSFLSSLVYKMTGQTCFSTEHIRVYLNGDYLGLYLMVENMDGDFLDANNYDPQGALYKATAEGACMSIYDDIANDWEQKTGPENKEELAHFIDQINQVSIDDYPGFCDINMNYNQVVNLIACNMVLSNTSTYYHNYYMYHDVHGSGRWEMMPWDLDKTFSINAWRNHTYSSPPWTPDNPFLEKAILHPGMMADINDRANHIFQEIFKADILHPIIDSLLAVIESSVIEDTTDNIENLDDWMFFVQKEKDYIDYYPGLLNWYFNHVQSSFTCEATPGVYPPTVTFNWTASVDPDGYPVDYRLLLTSGNRFQPELTQVFDGIQDTFLTIENIPEGNYFWKVISTDASGQEVDAFDSKNPLSVQIMEELPCHITEDIVLSAEHSPYLINCQIVVEPQAKLTIQEGVTIYIEQGNSLTIKGGLQVNGTEQHPVSLLPAYNGKQFDSLVFMEPQQTIEMNYVNFTNRLIYAYDANVMLNKCNFLLNTSIPTDSVHIFQQQLGNISIENSNFYGNGTCQGLVFSNIQLVNITNNHFENIDMSLNLHSIESGEIRNNSIKNSAAAGIMLSDCNNIYLEGNSIFNCPIGIALGGEINQNSDNNIISKNLLVNCATGLEVSNSFTALCDGNTFFQNETAVNLVEKTAGSGGGQLAIVNTIISSSLGSNITADSLSGFTIRYSICDIEIFEGTGNLYGDPKFVSPAHGNFQLQASSPCIDAGDPASTADPDGTIRDMGAFFVNQINYNIVFNEINYKSASHFDTGDWVELYNADSLTADISGWQFKDENDDHLYAIPYGTKIPAGEYLVLCNNSSKFSEKHPGVENHLGDFDFGLSSNGELIRLFSNTGQLINYVSYGVSNPWPTQPNGMGSTLELKNPFLANSMAENWCASAPYGTPGAANSCYVNSLESSNTKGFQARLYPNPASDRAFVNIQHNNGGQLYLQLFTSTGSQVFSMKKVLQGSGETPIEILTAPNKGVYLLLISFSQNSIITTSSIKLIVH